MSSPTRRAVAIAVLCAGAAACGHRGSPTPPLPRLPQAPQLLSLRQRGDRLEVTARYRALGLGGRSLEPPVHPVMLWLAPRDPSDLTGWETRQREREFTRNSEPVDLATLALGASGPDVVRADTVDVAAFGGRPAVVVAVALADERRRSLPSGRAVFRPMDPPLAPPSGVSVVAEETGVRLRWIGLADTRARAINLYRAVAGTPASLSPWRVLAGSEVETFDETATYGQKLTYSIAAARGGEGVEVESITVTPPAVDYKDEFAPRAPRDVTAVAETGAVRVFWFPGGSRDEARVVVERETLGTEGFVEAGRVELPETTFADTTAQPGQRYRYRASALDAAGNRSPLAGPTEWVEPRPAAVPFAVPPVTPEPAKPPAPTTPPEPPQ